VDASRFNENLNEQIANLQGLSRDQIPGGSVSETMFANEAFHDLTVAQTNTEIADPYRASSPATGSFPSWVVAPGMQYGSYSGDDVVAFTENVTTKGGLLHLEFSTWAWRNTATDRREVSGVLVDRPKAFRMRMLVDGIEVDSTANVYVPWMNIHLCGQVLVPEGQVSVQVVWSMTPIATYNSGATKDDDSLVMLFFAGSSLLLNQRRS
jgi:hypothetical protein